MLPVSVSWADSIFHAASNRYCIAGAFSLGADDRPHRCTADAGVTMGEKASEMAQELFKGDRYSDYLYFHGLAVQMAEAMAEWVHARIRSELGFADPESMPLRDVLAQRYRGSRYSFGYPACPNVADSRQQLTWLGADRIGLRMDASDQLEPEQSTQPWWHCTPRRVISAHSLGRTSG